MLNQGMRKGKERYAKAKVRKSKEINGKIRKGNQR